MCVCAGAVQRLGPLGHNAYRPDLPELPADATAQLPGDTELANLAPPPFDKLPEPSRTGRNPHKSFLQSMEQKHVQMYAKYSINPQRRRKEQVLQCSYKLNCHGTRCQYSATCPAELDRHERVGHVVPHSAASHVPSAIAGAAVGEVLFPDYR